VFLTGYSEVFLAGDWFLNARPITRPVTPDHAIAEEKLLLDIGNEHSTDFLWGFPIKPK
jgi:hypothetical protein